VRIAHRELTRVKFLSGECASLFGYEGIVGF